MSGEPYRPPGAVSGTGYRVKTVLSLVEKGWAAARWFSLELAQRGTPVRHLAKGTIPRPTREVLTPAPGVTLHGAPQRLYRAAAWAHLWKAQLTGKVTVVITDNTKTAGWVKKSFPRLREKVLLLGETETGRPQVLEKGAGVFLP